jgi:CBS domain-containing protein
MSRNVVEVSAEATCREAAQLMRDRNVGILLVTREGRILEGVITDRDLVTRCMAPGQDPGRARVGEYMDRHPHAVEGDLDLEGAVEVMRNARHRRLPVTTPPGKVIGLISLDDVAFDVKNYADAFLSAEGQYSRRRIEEEGALGE